MEAILEGIMIMTGLGLALEDTVADENHPLDHLPQAAPQKKHTKMPHYVSLMAKRHQMTVLCQNVHPTWSARRTWMTWEYAARNLVSLDFYPFPL